MSHLITLETAISMTSTYRENNDSILKQQHQNQNILPRCETYSREEFDLLLAQTNCEAVRIYYGMDENLRVHAIIVGVNSLNEDILEGQETLDPVIIEEGSRCPDDCPPTSDLNP